MTVFFFISVILAAGVILRILLKKVYEKAKRLFEIPRSKQYAICDGIYNLLWGGKFPNSKESSPIGRYFNGLYLLISILLTVLGRF